MTSGADIERRAAIELRATGSRIEGHAAVFGAASRDLGGFVEAIRPGAFRRSLDEGADVLALFDHDSRLVLGRRSAGTLELREDNRGLWFSIDVANTTVGRDALVSVGRGDVTGASFAFRSRVDEWTFPPEGPARRELVDVDLLDVTVTPFPAYADTTVARRALEGQRPMFRLALARRYLDTLGA
jgi:hypothetical protein